MPVGIYRHGGDVIDYTPGAAVSAGDVIVQGNLVGIASHDIAANRLGSLHVAGVFDLPKATGGGTAITAGATVYWDATNGVVTETASGNKLLGKTVAAAADGAALVRVRLSQ